MSLKQIIRKILRESRLPINVRRRINYDEENINNLLKKFALRNLGQNKKIHITSRLTCRDVAYELLDGIQSEFGDTEFNYMENVLTDYLEEKYGEQLKEFIKDFYDESGNELGSRYVFEKHSERHGGNGFSEGYETWNLLLKHYASWFPDLDWKELKMKLDNMKSGGKILIKKPGDINNNMGYYFSLQRFDDDKINKIEQTEGLHDTSWENEGEKITLIDLLNATDNIPVKNVSVEKLKPHLLSWNNDDEEIRKIESADLKYPILIFVEDDGEFISIIDGHHRAHKAIRKGLETIKAKIIPINILPKKIRKVFAHMGKLEQNKSEITEKCWKGYTQKGMKTMFGRRYPNCVKKTK